MKPYTWDKQKNEKLKKERGISFEEIIYFLSSGCLIDVLDNNKYEDQSIFALKIDNYIYLVPFRETADEIRLITVYKSRNATKNYLKQKE